MLQPNMSIRKSRGWCFTINNPTEADKNCIQNVECKFITCQEECGEQATRHLQGFVYFVNARGLKSVAADLGGRAHLERQRGTVEEAAEYCNKSESRVDGGFQHTRGDRPNQGRRSDLEPVYRDILDGKAPKEIAENHIREFVKYSNGITRACTLLQRARNEPTIVHWYCGPTGTGKSRRAQELAREITEGNDDDIYYKSPTDHWWDGYFGQTVVIIDDYRKDFCKFSELLRLFDRYPLRLQCKGGTVQFCSKNIFITCPYDPCEIWENRNAEDLNQLMRRINLILKFNIKQT